MMYYILKLLGLNNLGEICNTCLSLKDNYIIAQIMLEIKTTQ